MRANPAFPRHSGLGTVITSAAATLIALGILIGTTMLFQSRGKPMAELAAAERACAGQTYVSDRERCMREWVAAVWTDAKPDIWILWPNPELQALRRLMGLPTPIERW